MMESDSLLKLFVGSSHSCRLRKSMFVIIIKGLEMLYLTDIFILAEAGLRRNVLVLNSN